MFLFINLFLHINDWNDETLYLVTSFTMLFMAAVCAILGFYIFVDMNFDLTRNFIVLAVFSAVLVASWALFSYFVTDDFDYLSSVLVVLVLLCYLIFLYSRWKSNE
eukprot:TRINITY_DN6440_c0_g1_i2.p3 TRINITY_DN6440_c0_g1~~TRINITY_DN6440_c0_g1_i2.p3  ORF type:complete len:121 (-),score=35.50 TRINITY_DN6440_c0_g1_i2:514-831(-)